MMIQTDLPLVELHRHLDGNVRLETILDLGRQHNVNLPAWDLEGLRPFVQVTGAQPGVLAFFEKTTGLRMNHNYVRPGGVVADLPDGWRDDVLDICDAFEPRMHEYDELLTGQPIFLERTQGVGVRFPTDEKTRLLKLKIEEILGTSISSAKPTQTI